MIALATAIRPEPRRCLWAERSHATPQDPVEEGAVAERDRRRRQRQPHVPEAEDAHEGPVEDEVGDDRDDAHEHRHARVVERVEGRREHLDAGVAGEPDGIGGEGLRRERRVGGSEPAVLVHEPDDGNAEDGEAGGGREAEQGDELERLSDRAAERGRVATRPMA
jgi:hypothetical protein